jgi:hypothetical protein
MRTALVIAIPALLAATGCEPRPAYLDDPDLLRMLGDAGPVEPAAPRDCDAMVVVARQVYNFRPSVVAPRLGAEYFYQNCDWTRSGLTFEKETPDNRFVWVSFSAVKTDERGPFMETLRSNDGDGLQQTRCDLYPSGTSWQIKQCTNLGVILQQGQ